MAQKRPLAERLLDKLRKVGLPERKAKELAKGLAPTAARQTVSGTVTSKLEVKLFKMGLNSKKAQELAKVLAPVVRAAIKAKVKKEAKTLDDVTDDDVNEAVETTIKVRMDLPVAPMQGSKGIELLRVMDGLTTKATYLVAAVKGEFGIVAVRRLDPGTYNVKFYPNLAHWSKTQEDLSSLGAVEYLEREWYERMHFNPVSLGQLLGRLQAEAKPKSRMKALMDRFKTVTVHTLVKGFHTLYKKADVA